MSRLAATALFALLVAPAAWAQTPDEDWITPFPVGSESPALDPGVTPPPPPRQPLPLGSASPAAPRLPPVVRRPQRKKEEPNTVSMMGALPLGQWKRGQAFLLGFPLLQVRAAIGLTDTLDVGLGFDSFYGAMNEFRAQARLGGVGGGGWQVAASLEAGIAFFTVGAAREVRGPRWLTGRRNFNIEPGIKVSLQGAHPRAARLFLDVRYLVAFDTEPFATDPLAGVPPSLIVGSNLVLRGGAELPLSKTTAFIFQLGIDGHFRGEDAPVMPSASVGLVTGI